MREALLLQRLPAFLQNRKLRQEQLALPVQIILQRRLVGKGGTAHTAWFQVACSGQAAQVVNTAILHSRLKPANFPHTGRPGMAATAGAQAVFICNPAHLCLTLL